MSEVQAAYRKRAKILHPDRFDQATQPQEWQEANQMFMELNEAYNAIKADLELETQPRAATNTYQKPKASAFHPTYESDQQREAWEAFEKAGDDFDRLFAPKNIFCSISFWLGPVAIGIGLVKNKYTLVLVALLICSSILGFIALSRNTKQVGRIEATTGLIGAGVAVWFYFYNS